MGVVQAHAARWACDGAAGCGGDVGPVGTSGNPKSTYCASQNKTPLLIYRSTLVSREVYYSCCRVAGTPGHSASA